jgi:hypothetical protein
VATVPATVVATRYVLAGLLVGGVRRGAVAGLRACHFGIFVVRGRAMPGSRIHGLRASSNRQWARHEKDDQRRREWQSRDQPS